MTHLEPEAEKVLRSLPRDMTAAEICNTQSPLRVLDRSLYFQAAVERDKHGWAIVYEVARTTAGDLYLAAIDHERLLADQRVEAERKAIAAELLTIGENLGGVLEAARDGGDPIPLERQADDTGIALQRLADTLIQKGGDDA